MFYSGYILESAARKLLTTFDIVLYASVYYIFYLQDRLTLQYRIDSMLCSISTEQMY